MHRENEIDEFRAFMAEAGFREEELSEGSEALGILNEFETIESPVWVPPLMCYLLPMLFLIRPLAGEVLYFSFRSLLFLLMFAMMIGFLLNFSRKVNGVYYDGAIQDDFAFQLFRRFTK